MIVFIHIPKNGGTTIGKSLEKSFGMSYVDFNQPQFQCSGYKLRIAKLLGKPFAERNSHNQLTVDIRRIPQTINAIKGHIYRHNVVNIPDSGFVFTVTRDPIDRTISEFLYSLRHSVKPFQRMPWATDFPAYIDRFHEHQIHQANSQTRFIIDEPYKNRMLLNMPASSLSEKQKLSIYAQIDNAVEKFDLIVSLRDLESNRAVLEEQGVSQIDLTTKHNIGPDRDEITLDKSCSEKINDIHWADLYLNKLVTMS